MCVGAGGVGKTTTAAAIALRATRHRLRVLVLTIDPAKRLANSLGLTQLGHEVQQVPMASNAGDGGGELWAMMLDQKQAFDEVVTANAADPDAVRRVIANPIYQQISTSLAGAQEYAAIAKLQEFHESGRWDLIVVDTPPTAHALDFLDAPAKLSNAIASPAAEWFRKLKQSHEQGRRWSLVGRTGRSVLKRLSQFVGSQFLDDLAVFFTEFDDVLAGFRSRADAAFTLLRQQSAGFVLVCTPDPMAVDEALFFYQRLVESDMPLTAVVVNRVHSYRPLSGDRRTIADRLAEVPQVRALGFDHDQLAEVAGTFLENHTALHRLAQEDKQAIHRLRRDTPAAPALISIPFFDRDIHDIPGLHHIGDYLFRDEDVSGIATRPVV